MTTIHYLPGIRHDRPYVLHTRDPHGHTRYVDHLTQAEAEHLGDTLLRALHCAEADTDNRRPMPVPPADPQDRADLQPAPLDLAQCSILPWSTCTTK